MEAIRSLNACAAARTTIPAGFCNFSRGAGLFGYNSILPMKTALISFLTASLLGVASFATGHSFTAADFVIVLFTTGLVAWTVEQYSREARPLLTERPLRFPVELTASARRNVEVRLAA